MIWHGLWYQWAYLLVGTPGAFMLTRHPLRKMNDGKPPVYSGPGPLRPGPPVYSGPGPLRPGDPIFVNGQITGLKLDELSTRLECTDCGTLFGDVQNRPTFGVALCRLCCINRKRRMGIWTDRNNQ